MSTTKMIHVQSHRPSEPKIAPDTMNPISKRDALDELAKNDGSTLLDASGCKPIESPETHMFSVHEKNIIHLFEIGRFSGDEKTNYQTKETQDRTEDLDHEDLDKPGSSVSGSRWKDVKGENKEIGWTHKLGSAASARAALLPLIPTEIPQTKLHMPTVTPAQKRAYPV